MRKRIDSLSQIEMQSAVTLMNNHRIKTALTENGKLSLQNLPFKKGDKVEIIILQQSTSTAKSNAYPLKDTVILYEDPFEAVIPPEEWNANN